MKVYEEKHKLRLPESHGRSVGLHVSDVIRDYALAGGTLDKKWVSELLIEEQNTNMMQIGLAFEDYIAASRQHPEIEIHPGELMIVDKGFCSKCKQLIDKKRTNASGCGCRSMRPTYLTIYLSPDGISIVDDDDLYDCIRIWERLVHEFKFTRKSSRNFAQELRMRSKKVRMWLWQIMAYCYAAKSLAAKLHVMFVNGNYSWKEEDPENTATYKIFRLEFSQTDLDENWLMLRNHARRMVTR